MFKSILMCDNTIAPQKESPPDLIKWVYPDCKIEATHILSTKNTEKFESSIQSIYVK